MSSLPVPDTLTTVADAAKSAFGDDLLSIILYGSAAENRLRATSDINVLFVLARFDEAKANAFRESYRFAQAAHNVRAMFLRGDEIDAASEEFAQKFADIARRHVVLYGSDPFAELTISREALARRLRQVLLNLSLRMREMYVERSLREEQCAVTLAEAAAPLRTSAAAILELQERGVHPPKEALEILGGELGFAHLLPHISEAREQRTLPAGRAAELLFAAVELSRAMYERARNL
ncbi:MAG TPA: nucleotidyltransferase domain-containing protein [Thermoanaerobaculia bacterium]|jgi:hypothetical protein